MPNARPRPTRGAPWHRTFDALESLPRIEPLDDHGTLSLAETPEAMRGRWAPTDLDAVDLAELPIRFPMMVIGGGTLLVFGAACLAGRHDDLVDQLVGWVF